uniref:Uncharacterized protein n=1 Tax=Anopheles farauti TaxID=69004 RepID=A0A182QDE0_9DIPT
MHMCDGDFRPVSEMQNAPRKSKVARHPLSEPFDDGSKNSIGSELMGLSLNVCSINVADHYTRSFSWHPYMADWMDSRAFPGDIAVAELVGWLEADVWVVRARKRFLELLELEAGEGRPVAALLPLRGKVVPTVVAVRVGERAVRVATAAAHQLTGAGTALQWTALGWPCLMGSDILQPAALLRYAHWSTGLL